MLESNGKLHVDELVSNDCFHERAVIYMQHKLLTNYVTYLRQELSFKQFYWHFETNIEQKFT